MTGKAPTLHNLESTEGKQDDQRALAVQDSHSVKQENLEEYEIHYSDITLNLLNIGDQRTVDVRFPTVTETETVKFLGNTGYWTNHPECIKRTWIEKQENPPVVGIEQWIHFEVDISTLIE